MTKRSSAFIWQFVLGLGFLSGLWTAAGIDPGAIVLNVLGTIIDTIYSDPLVRSILLLLPIILLIVSILGAYKRGKVLGLGSVMVAYIAGLFILISIVISFVLLGTAVITGYLATNRRLRRKLTGI